jgi:putative ABC transport system permease protein
VLPALAPVLQPGIPAWSAGASLLVAIGTGVAFGTAPARRAAALDPVLALARR